MQQLQYQLIMLKNVLLLLFFILLACRIQHWQQAWNSDLYHEVKVWYISKVNVRRALHIQTYILDERKCLLHTSDDVMED